MLLLKPYQAALSSVLLVMMTLSGCAGLANNPTPPPIIDLEATAAAVFPELSLADAQRCYDPGVPAGVDALEIIANHRVALSDCRQRHARVVAQYRDAKDVLTSTTTTAQELLK